MPSKTTTETTNTGLNACLCGCGDTTRGSYRPGHDARHASAVARAIAENPRRAKSLLAALPSAALQAKASRAAERLTAKSTETEEGK